MQKGFSFLTIANFVVCLLFLSVIFFKRSDAQANVNINLPNPFLGHIYYGSTNVLKVFDHEYPLFNTPYGEGANQVRHYDGSLHDPFDPLYGYDQHIGIDYGLIYRPVLAAATGTVTRAEWANPSNHRLSYGLHVRMQFDDNADYEFIYGHLSTLTVKQGQIVVVDETNLSSRSRILGVRGGGGVTNGELSASTVAFSISLLCNV